MADAGGVVAALPLLKDQGGDQIGEAACVHRGDEEVGFFQGAVGKGEVLGTFPFHTHRLRSGPRIVEPKIVENSS